MSSIGFPMLVAFFTTQFFGAIKNEIDPMTSYYSFLVMFIFFKWVATTNQQQFCCLSSRHQLQLLRWRLSSEPSWMIGFGFDFCSGNFSGLKGMKKPEFELYIYIDTKNRHVE